MLYNISRIASGQFIAQLILLVSLPFITRHYNPQEFGIFAVFSAIAWILVSFSTGKLEALIITMETKNKSCRVNTRFTNNYINIQFCHFLDFRNFLCCTSSWFIVKFNASIGTYWGDCFFYWWRANVKVLRNIFRPFFMPWYCSCTKFRRSYFRCTWVCYFYWREFLIRWTYIRSNTRTFVIFYNLFMLYCHYSNDKYKYF